MKFKASGAVSGGASKNLLKPPSGLRFYARLMVEGTSMHWTKQPISCAPEQLGTSVPLPLGAPIVLRLQRRVEGYRS